MILPYFKKLQHQGSSMKKQKTIVPSPSIICSTEGPRQQNGDGDRDEDGDGDEDGDRDE